ncbi:Cloroperoxidase [Athelia psychrophila]|uniref:Cloroperoxidase n=1 Tax=Athelia psychrophila TaxID=1759441 RepID=A0A166CKP7_9AGAM|nr:Cloroperoxidase [Fibularhizoctonia sp. CBS 109695]
MGILDSLVNLLVTIYVFSLDGLLVIGNLLLPNRAPGMVVPEGHPGFGGKWPEYIPPKEGDSRSSCPGINAMANHGIIARDGRNISFVELTRTVQATYNFAPTFSFFLPNYAARFMHRSYSTGTFDLHELDKHNEIEHDASLMREDAYLEPDQSKIAPPLVEDLLARASGPSGELTAKDIADAMSQRIADCDAENPEFTTNVLHRLFGAGNASMMMSLFGGSVPDLRALLLEERFLDGWLPTDASRYGLTLGAFNVPAIRLLFDTTIAYAGAHLNDRSKATSMISDALLSSLGAERSIGLGLGHIWGGSSLQDRAAQRASGIVFTIGIPGSISV